MANTYVLIASNTLTSSAASVTFSSIPSTYTDLVLRISARSSAAGGPTTLGTYFYVTANGNSTNYSYTRLQVLAGTVSSERASNATIIWAGGAPNQSSTNNTFCNTEIYIPNYTNSTSKPVSSFSLAETNEADPNWGTNGQWGVIAGLDRNASAITSVSITIGSSNFVSGSSFFLYGIKNS